MRLGLPSLRSSKVKVGLDDDSASGRPASGGEGREGGDGSSGGADATPTGTAAPAAHDLECGSADDTSGPIPAAPSTTDLSPRTARAEAAEARAADLEARVEELEAVADRADQVAGELREFRKEVRERLSELEKAREKKYAALLLAPVSRVSRGSKRGRLLSVQSVLFAITFMMSTFETGNRCVRSPVSLPSRHHPRLHAGTSLPDEDPTRLAPIQPRDPRPHHHPTQEHDHRRHGIDCGPGQPLRAAQVWRVGRRVVCGPSDSIRKPCVARRAQFGGGGSVQEGVWRRIRQVY